MNKKRPAKKKPKPMGRPLKWKDPGEMSRAVDQYFDNLINEPPTVMGLILHLGFIDKCSFQDYEKRPAFTSLIKKSRSRIEKYWEARLISQAPTGAIFWLKNHGGYRDKTEVDNNTTIQGVIRLPAKKEIGAPVDGAANAPS